MEQSTIKNIFQPFVGHDDRREEMNSPMKQNGFYFATDAHTLICCPVSICPDADFEERNKPNCTAVMPTERTEAIEIETSFINTINEVLPMTEETKIELIDCKECYGSGIVECNYGHEHECDECDASGKKEGKKKTGNVIKDFYCLIKVWGIIFRYQELKKVFEVANKLNLAKFSLIRGAQSKGNLFQVGDFQVLIMSHHDFDNLSVKVPPCALAGIKI